MTIQPKDITLSFVSENRETGEVTRQVDVNAASLMVVRVVNVATRVSYALGYNSVKQKITKGKGPRDRWGTCK